MKSRFRRNSAGSTPHACRRGSSGFPPKGAFRRTSPMHRGILAALAALSLAFLTLLPGRADQHRLSGPVVHENLAIYLIHGTSAAGPVPLTLAEALAKSAVKVHETGNVNELE